MSGTTSAITLWLFVVNLGIAFGAGVYEHRIVVSRWISGSPQAGITWNAEVARRDDTGRRFWAFVTTVPLTLVTVANLAAASQAQGAVRVWWLVAGFMALADRAFTFSYFIPTMIGLMRTTNSAASVSAATAWRNLNYVRHAIVLIAWLASLKAFGLFFQQRG